MCRAERILLNNSYTARRSQISQNKILNRSVFGGVTWRNQFFGERLLTFPKFAVAERSFSTESAGAALSLVHAAGPW